MTEMWERSTAYRRAWERFMRWCEQEDRVALPCTSATLAAYVDHLVATSNMAPASLRVHVSAIRSKHPSEARPSAAEAGQKIAAWKTSLKQSGRQQRQTQMLTSTQLESLIATCRARGLRDLRDAAILTLAVSSGAQAQELEALTPDAIEVHPSGVALRTQVAARFAHTVPNSLLDPVEAMTSWQQRLVSEGVVSKWAFPLVDVQGVLRPDVPSTRHTMRQIIQRRGNEAGLNTKGLTFRSLRASFVAGRNEAAFSEQVIAEQATWLAPIPRPRYAPQL